MFFPRVIIFVFGTDDMVVSCWFYWCIQQNEQGCYLTIDKQQDVKAYQETICLNHEAIDFR